MTNDNTDIDRRRRREVEASVSIGGKHNVPGGMNFLNGEVEITVSGSPKDGEDVYRLVDAIEDSVVEAVESFEATEYQKQK